MIVVEETIRTVLWRGLGKLNYMDIGTVVVSSWKGGRDIVRTSDYDTMNRMFRLHSWPMKDEGDIRSISGKTRVTLDEEADTLVLGYEKEA